MVLKYEKRDKIAYLTLNRPDARNAVNPELIMALVEAWTDYRDDKDMRCAIITGAGEKAFCAGADLARLIPLFTGVRQPETEADKAIAKNPLLSSKALLRDFEIYKPIIAAINGHAIAGGLEMLYSTDIRIACPEARFGLQEVKWAIFPAGGSSVHLPRQLPYAKAMEMLLTGELITAEEAYSYGLINKIVPRDEIVAEAERYAQLIVKNGPVAVSAIKKSVLTTSGMTLKEGLDKETELAMPVFATKDAQEGPRAFMEKREPNYIGE
jgi:enoyl-CoA hydratase